MQVKISNNLSATLEFPEDFKRFSVNVEGNPSDQPRVRDAISSVGDMTDAETMWVKETWLRTAPGRSEAPEWKDGVSNMIAGAKKYGWVDEATGCIKAHVVWTETAQ